MWVRYLQIVNKPTTDTADVFTVQKTTDKVGIRSLPVIQLQKVPIHVKIKMRQARYVCIILIL